MITIRESLFIRYEDTDKVMRMELEIGTVSELPSADFLEGHILYQGSIAHVISTGDFYAIDSTGTWYNQDGSGAYSPTAVTDTHSNIVDLSRHSVQDGTDTASVCIEEEGEVETNEKGNGFDTEDR